MNHDSDLHYSTRATMARTSSSGSGGRRHASSSHNVIGLGASAASGDGGGASSSADAEQPPALRVTAAKLSASEQDARIRRVVSEKQILTFTGQCSLFTLSVYTDAGGKISLISGVLQQSVADVLGGGQALSLYGCVNDENGRQISVTASLLVTRLPSTEDVQFNGHISIGAAVNRSPSLQRATKLHSSDPPAASHSQSRRRSFSMRKTSKKKRRTFKTAEKLLIRTTGSTTAQNALPRISKVPASILASLRSGEKQQSPATTMTWARKYSSIARATYSSRIVKPSR